MIITQTPLRISLGGGGSDFADYFEHREGYVVSAALDKAAFVIVMPRYDDRIYVNYSRKEIVDHVDQIEHDLVRESLKLTGIEHGVEITLMSDIPSEGAGLGSSSSFTVGLLNGVHVYQGDQVGPARLAEEACEVEIYRCGRPIGKQDQYIAAFGGVTAFRFLQSGRVDVERLKLGADGLRRMSANLFLFYSGQTRDAATILKEQKSRTAANMSMLDKLKDLGVDARDAVSSGDFDGLGRVLHESWQLKKLLASEITNARLDEMHTRAMEGGATGAKICGAGGGGFLLVYCPGGAHERIRSAMAQYREMPVRIERDGSKVIFHYQRPSWK